MSKQPGAENSAKKAVPKSVVPKRPLSKWDRERRRRRIIGIIISVVIAGVVISGGIVAYVNLYRPWHQPIVGVNGTVYDMNYFVKMCRYYGVEKDTVDQYADVIVEIVQRNELARQKAKTLSKELDVDISDITDDDIDVWIQNYFSYDPEGELTLEEFNLWVNNLLRSQDISRGDFEKFQIIPNILSERVKEAIGNEEYPVDATYPHVRVKAVLLGTEEEAEEVIGKWEEDFNQIIKDYSPSVYYPEGGYWLVMVYEPEEEEEHEEEGRYIQAILLATKEKADEVAAKIEAGDDLSELAQAYSLDDSAEDGGDLGWMSLDDIELKFGNLDTVEDLEVNELSEPIFQNYPDDPVEWLPEGIEESSVFEEYAFDDENTGGGVSEPIRDTTVKTSGGYWLIMITEGDGNGEEGELYINTILLDSEEKAEALKAEIEAGGDFTTLAKENSLDSSAAKGGVLGWMSQVDIETKFGAGVLATINDLDLDEISAPIQTTDGYWLVVVSENDGEGKEGELHINAMLLASKAKAEEVAAEFDGSNFAELAKEYSLDSSAGDGGDMGWMSQDDIESKFGTGVLAITNNLTEDEISTPIYDDDVSKQSGYWVIEVLDREDRTYIETHRDAFVDEYYSKWLDGEMKTGKEDGWIKDYLDDKKISWIKEHI